MREKYTGRRCSTQRSEIVFFGDSIMSADQNKALVREYVDTWNRGDVEGLSHFWGPGMVHHNRNVKQSGDEVQRVISNFMSAFPDLSFEIDDMFGESDRVVTRMTAKGTHQGEFMGYAPTGKHFNCSLIGIARIADGKFVEHWGITDEIAIMAQIGALPEQYLQAMS
jgi:C-1 hydroxylase